MRLITPTRIMAILDSLLVAARAEQPPATVAGAQFSKWLDAFNTGDDTTLLSYHETNFPYDVASHDVGTIDLELSLSRSTGGFNFMMAKDSEEYQFTAILREVKSVQFASVTIRVGTVPPNKVAKFEIGPISTPEEFMSPEEREARRLSPEKCITLVDAVASNIENNYITKSVAGIMARTLRENLKTGQYDNINDMYDLANTLTKTIHSVYDDKHMRILFIWPPRSEGAPSDDSEVMKNLRAVNFGFGDIKKHSHGIASIELNGFVPSHLEEAKDEIAHRMSLVADATALIVDLRRNRGGIPETVSLIASYLFGDEKVHLNDMYDPRLGTTEEFWTDPAVKGTKFGQSKPIYIVTSSETISGGEEFSNDFQALRRAVLVGETTAGAANPGRPYEIEPGFVAIIPSVYPVNPTTGTNWEGTGVAPDIRAGAEHAFEEAMKKALEELGIEDEDTDKHIIQEEEQIPIKAEE